MATVKAEFLAVGKAHKAIFWPTSGSKERTFDTSGFSAEETFTSVSVVSQSKRSGLKYARRGQARKTYRLSCLATWPSLTAVQHVKLRQPTDTMSAKEGQATQPPTAVQHVKQRSADRYYERKGRSGNMTPYSSPACEIAFGQQMLWKEREVKLYTLLQTLHFLHWKSVRTK